MKLMYLASIFVKRLKYEKSKIFNTVVYTKDNCIFYKVKYLLDGYNIMKQLNHLMPKD